jgi:hypothetical protein
MHRRRVVYQLDFDATAPAPALRGLPDRIRALYGRFSDVTFERCHLVRFADGNPRFEIAYVVETPDFNRHLSVLHEANLGLHEDLAGMGLRFAIPARSIRMRSDRPRGERDRRVEAYPDPDSDPDPGPDPDGRAGRDDDSAPEGSAPAR